jgi:hypothetical protein
VALSTNCLFTILTQTPSLPPSLLRQDRASLLFRFKEWFSQGGGVDDLATLTAKSVGVLLMEPDLSAPRAAGRFVRLKRCLQVQLVYCDILVSLRLQVSRQAR